METISVCHSIADSENIKCKLWCLLFDLSAEAYGLMISNTEITIFCMVLTIPLCRRSMVGINLQFATFSAIQWNKTLNFLKLEQDITGETYFFYFSKESTFSLTSTMDSQETVLLRIVLFF